VLAARCRNIGLEPVMMFSTVNFEEPHAADAYKKRIDQAHAAGINSIIVFGSVRGGSYADSIKSLKQAAPHAEGTNVKLLVKQHGGISATGQDCAKIIADVNHPSVKICYDAGNVLDYESHDPIPDIQKCWQDIRAFAIKDHRDFPKDQDCGAGFGEIDHYKLLMPVMRTGLTMPLSAENIFEPLNPRPTDPDQIDQLARRSREYIESVLSGLDRHLSASA
jgi:sugar phosphate isomerase/epimerase